MTPPGRDVRHAAGTLILRERRIVSASDGAATISGRPVEALVGLSFLDLVAPRERARVEDRHARRLLGEPVPSEYETAVLLPDGSVRPVALYVTVEGRDVVVQLRDLSAEAARRPRVAALAALGAGIQRERTEAEVLARVEDGAAELGLSSFLLRAGTEGIRVERVRVPRTAEVTFADRLGRGMVGYTGPWSAFSRAAWDDGAAFSDDWGSEAAAFLPREHRAEARELAAALGLERAVAVRLDERGGARLSLVLAGGWLRAEDLAAARLFGAQVAAALDAARTIADLSRQNADLAALNRIGELAGEAADLETLFRRAGEVVTRAAGCAGLAIFVLDESDGQLVRIHERGAPAAGSARPERVPLASPLGEVVRDRVARVISADEGAAGDPDPLSWTPFRTAAWVPLVARSKVVGVMAVGFAAGAELVRGRLDLLAAIGAHFASAVESHGLLSDLRRRVSELTLLNDVAMASAQLDPVLLLDSALRRVCETFETDAGAAYLREGERLVIASSIGVGAETAQRFAHIGLDEALPGAAVRRLGPVVSTDLASADPTTAAVAGLEGFQSAVAVPLLAKGQSPVGALVFARRARRGIGEGEVTLLSAIGVQLGVAVENARLFANVRRRLSDLEAVHALALRIFGNAPGDVQALLDDGCRETARALSCRAAAILLADEDGKVLRGVAAHGAPLAPERITVALEQDGLAADAIRRKAPAWSEDVSRDRRSGLFGNAAVPPLAMLVVPLTSRAATRGVLYLADDAGRAFTEADLALANALAGELAVGLENAELYSETRRRAEELGLLHEVGRSLVQTLEIDQVLEAGVRNLARMVDAPRALVAFGTDGHLEVRAVFGGPPSVVGQRHPVRPGDGSISSLVYERREPVVVEDARTDPRVRQELRAEDGASAYLGLPLLVRDRSIGSAVIVETRGPRRFGAAEVERAAAIANQLAVAVENARLYEDLRRSYAELAHAQRQLIQQERLAALGQLSAVVAHEVRNPLGVIFNSLGSLRRLLRPQGDARMLLDIVGEEADRLNRIVGDLLDFARPSTPCLRPEALDRVVDDAVQAAVAQNAAAVEVRHERSGELPPVPMDARLVRQAVLNVAVNAVQAMPRGGALTIRMRREDGTALLELEDTGPGIPEEVQHRIFEPFFTTKASGTGLGLAVVKRIVDGHGGEVAVRTGSRGGTVFVLRFPLTPLGGDDEGEVANG